MSYFEKYKKYKTKYIKLKSQTGGNNKRVLIFDFDQTITKTGTEPGIDIELYQLCELFNDQEFINKVKDFKDKGNMVAILSYGYREIIDAFLKNHGLTKLFGTIFTPSVFGLQEGYEHIDKLDGKNKMISALLEALNLNELLNDKSKVMLVDDNTKNVYRALIAGYNAILSDKTGLSNANKDILLNFMKGEYIKVDVCKNLIDYHGNCEKEHVLKHFQNGEVCCVKSFPKK